MTVLTCPTKRQPRWTNSTCSAVKSARPCSVLKVTRMLKWMSISKGNVLISIWLLSIIPQMRRKKHSSYLLKINSQSSTGCHKSQDYSPCPLDTMMNSLRQRTTLRMVMISQLISDGRLIKWLLRRSITFRKSLLIPGEFIFLISIQKHSFGLAKVLSKKIRSRPLSKWLWTPWQSFTAEATTG